MADDRQERIVRARLRLKERFEEQMRRTPALADPRPQGSGPPNRHGMPEIPVGQTPTDKWPVLDLGEKPQIRREDWRLALTGACEHPTTLSWADLMALPQVDDVSDFHCVTTWSRLGIRWRGVRMLEVAALAVPKDDATHVMCHASDGYSTNVPLDEALKPDVLLVYEADGAALPIEHGGPVRMITPQLYAWKGAKWIDAIEFMVGDRAGFWEERGYSMSAHPWRNDRYRR